MLSLCAQSHKSLSLLTACFFLGSTTVANEKPGLKNAFLTMDFLKCGGQ